MDIDKILQHMEKEDLQQREQGLGREKRWRSVPKVTGQFLYQIVMIHRPAVIVEIGLSQGYSALWMGRAAQNYGGVVHSYEVKDWRYRTAVDNIVKAGLESVVYPHLVSIDHSDYPDSIDLAFIDAEKSDYVQHFRNLDPRIVKGGIVLADNTISHSDDLESYIKTVREHSRYHSIGIPIGMGIELSRKLVTEEAKPAYS